MELAKPQRARRVRRTQAERSTATQTELLRSCLHLFARRGFPSTSLDEIASAVGLTKGAIYWHFRSKDALFDALLDYIRRQWRTTVLRPMLESRDPVSRFQLLFDGYQALFEREPDECLFLQRITLDADDHYARRVRAVYAQTAKVVVAIINQGKRVGVFRRDVNSTVLAYAALASLTGANAHAASNPSVTLAALIDEVKEALLRQVLCAGRVRKTG
jgi:TetR/AcrR family acrAB operon transcriptional repressor